MPTEEESSVLRREAKQRLDERERRLNLMLTALQRWYAVYPIPTTYMHQQLDRAHADDDLYKAVNYLLDALWPETDITPVALEVFHRNNPPS